MARRGYTAYRFCAENCRLFAAFRESRKYFFDYNFLGYNFRNNFLFGLGRRFAAEGGRPADGRLAVDRIAVFALEGGRPVDGRHADGRIAAFALAVFRLAGGRIAVFALEVFAVFRLGAFEVFRPAAYRFGSAGLSRRLVWRRFEAGLGYPGFF